MRGAYSIVPVSVNSAITEFMTCSAHFLIGHFASAIGQHDFRFVAFFQKSLNLPDLDLEIVLVRPWTQFDFLDLGRFLVSPTLMVFLAQLILVLAVIHDAADWRRRRRRDFHQIVSAFLRLLERFRRRKDAELLAFRPDHPDFTDSNLAVHPKFGNDRPPLMM